MIHALWSVGGGLLALGLLDLLVADFLDLELLAREARLRPPYRDHFRSAWNFDCWQDIAEEAAGWGHALLTCFWLGLAAGLHAVLRCMRSNVAGRLEVAMATVAVLATTAIVALWIAAEAVVRDAMFADNFIAVEPGVWMRWVTNMQYLQALPWRAFAGQALAGALAVVLLPCAATASGMVAVRCGRSSAQVWSRIAALALPMSIAVTAAAWLRIHYRIDELSDDPYETWPAAVRSAESWVLGSAVLVLVIGGGLLRGTSTGRSRWALAAAMGGLGVAAALATAPHRTAYQALYPALDRGTGLLGLGWVSSPPTIDPPRIDVCDGAWEVPRAVLSVDPSRGPLLEVEGMHWWLDAPNLEYPFRRWLRQEFDGQYHDSIALLVDRRVPAALVVPLVEAAREVGVPYIKVEAAAVATFSTTDGSATTWSICTLGELAVEAFLAGEPSGKTWGDVIADGMVAPVPERVFPVWRRY
ncbi:hypothetical protein [Nannocystis punicea]|uniref:Uncharacterized protein n=1 Tax=Nannocystis punicea TaxID=2995304 RepID=A0ABY7HBI1_9BACT|nr:hypothetical protein [Nannocystis poenicansa]WAS96445.1 hypothetical protein O0S08_09825 [Nannocystis poenicansa]